MTDSLIEFILTSAEETINLGKRIASFLKPGSVIALDGELGSGKTTLTKGIAAGLGIKEIITSPTYTIINQYEFNHEPHEPHEHYTFFHIDTYRLKDEEDFINIGGKDIIDSDGICIIEWSNKIKNLLPPNTITINIEIIEAKLRRISITNMDKIGI